MLWAELLRFLSSQRSLRSLHCPGLNVRSARITALLTLLGAMLEEPIAEGATGPPKMKGSAMLIGAKTREEVEKRLKEDVYVEGGVWDLSKIQIIPFKSALRKAL
jgi:hypothetical protein